jgi:hypothetical protein
LCDSPPLAYIHGSSSTNIFIILKLEESITQLNILTLYNAPTQELKGMIILLTSHTSNDHPHPPLSWTWLLWRYIHSLHDHSRPGINHLLHMISHSFGCFDFLQVLLFIGQHETLIYVYNIVDIN